MKIRFILGGSVSILFVIVFMSINYYLYKDFFYQIKPSIKVENIVINSDKDKDGISDPDDILEGARKEIINHTTYRSAYYSGGYPPDNEGVCTDVIWRALKNAGYDLKYFMDKDIKQNLKDYSGSIEKPDPNIDFRRVKNQYVFLKRCATKLTLEVIPNDKSNLIQWQRGDIIVLPSHIAIVSDKRRKDGVPYIIHNSETYPMEQDRLLKWFNEKKIIGHFRIVETKVWN